MIFYCLTYKITVQYSAALYYTTLCLVSNSVYYNELKYFLSSVIIWLYERFSQADYEVCLTAYANAGKPTRYSLATLKSKIAVIKVELYLFTDACRLHDRGI